MPNKSIPNRNPAPKAEAAEHRLGNVSSEIVFETLRVLVSASRPLSVADIHRALNEPISSAHRAIVTLESTGYATYHRGSTKLAPGAMCSNLVRALVNRYRLRQFARPYLLRLVELTEGAATLNVRLGWYTIRVASIEGRTEYFGQRRIGEARLLHEPAAPLTVLAFLAPARLAAYRAFIGKRHPEFARAAAGVGAAIETARPQGFLRHPDPERPGWNWVGFPFRDEAGEAAAAITLSLRDVVADDPAGGMMKEIRATLEALQRDALAEPGPGEMPFGHVPWGEIVLKLEPDRTD